MGFESHTDKNFHKMSICTLSTQKVRVQSDVYFHRIFRATNSHRLVQCLNVKSDHIIEIPSMRLLWDKEELQLQLDSHMRFVPGPLQHQSTCQNLWPSLVIWDTPCTCSNWRTGDILETSLLEHFHFFVKLYLLDSDTVLSEDFRRGT